MQSDTTGSVWNLPAAQRGEIVTRIVIPSCARAVIAESFLHRKLNHFAIYYNQRRVHAGLSGQTPFEQCDTTASQPANLNHYAWRSDCSGLFHTPMPRDSHFAMVTVNATKPGNADRSLAHACAPPRP